jgi:hypothetical protein
METLLKQAVSPPHANEQDLRSYVVAAGHSISRASGVSALVPTFSLSSDFALFY